MPDGGAKGRTVRNGARADEVADEGRLVAGRYRLLEQIGRGGMGTVWRAEDELLGRHVALKKLHVSPHLADDERDTLYERTRREARSAARITHPNVVVVHDVVDDGGLPCIVMEYVPSRTLGEVLKQDGPLPPQEAARIGRGMIAALRAAHAAGVLHRDVKPGNVLLGADGRVVLTDFGIAVASGTSTLTKTGELVGSVDYVAPERVRGGKPGPASDLWALGATLYQAVEGRPPFRKDTAIETAYAIAVDPLVPPRGAGPLALLIEQLLTKDPQTRPPAETVELRLRAPAEAQFAQPPGPVSRNAEGRAMATAPTAASPDRDGPDVPDGPGRASEHPRKSPHARPHTPPRRRVAVRAAVVAVVAVAAAAATVLMLRPESGSQTTPSQGGQVEKPSGTSAGPVSPTAKPSPVPDGYHLVREREVGLSFPVPDGWTRKELPDSTIVYIDPTELASLRVNVLDFASTSPLQHWKDDEAKSLREGKLPGYKQRRMQTTSYRGQPAAIWEFTFQGRAREFQAIDLGFGRPGEKEYAIYLSAPSADWAAFRPVFDHVGDGLHIESEQTG
ncbi:serine/threonine-protein kinase [Streptomyces sp. ISL-100]|uniref:serine/threonine-protein kinase n=1 Tax=Streptomyces sp. ISL-100 TaxID=2819173 RepID=UPI001BE689EA|nr:serine/threonine-protein kinase [Streptomyces sp. ISL-100]MBT2397055.1 protein kinase [Streptomyces sp. ISL-100]